MKKLRRVLSWILILTLCCGEMTPQLAVYAAGEETAVEEEGVSISDDEAAVSGDEAVSEDAAEEEKIPEDAVSGDSVSEDEAAEEEETAVSENETVSEDEVTAPEDEQEPAAEEESGSGYEDGLVSDDVEAGEESDDNADSFSRLTFKMKYDQKEGRNAGVSINAIRKDGKKDGLTYDNGLEQKATLRAAEAAIYFSNTRPDGRNFDTIYNDNDTAKGKARKEILIREGVNGGEAADIFRSVSLNSLLSDSYHYMAVGHVVFQGTHYWALELTEFPTNLANRNPSVEDVNVPMDVLDKFLSNKDVSASLAAGTKIKVDTNVAKDLPTFSAYVVSREHKPENAKLPVITDAPVWKADNKLQASIKNNKLTVKADEGTDGNITATIKLANKEFSFTYPVHVIVHVKSIAMSFYSSVMKPDEEQDLHIKVVPDNADDKTFTIKVADEKIVKVEAPNKQHASYEIVAYAKGSTTINVTANDNYNKAKDSKTITVDAVQSVEMPRVADYKSTIGKKDTVRLYTTTPDADIYYLTFGDIFYDEEGNIINSPEEQKKYQAYYDDNPELFTKYTRPFTLSENSTIRMVAMKNTVSGSTIYSDYNMCYISVAEEGWGDITTEDQVQWASPDEVPDGFWVAAASIPELVYNGKAQKPDSFRVYDHNKLINSKNYKIAYSNNINATASANALFKFKGSYTGELTRYFAINRASVSYAQIGKAGAVANGSAITPDITVTVGGRKLKKDVDYTVSCDETIIKEGTYTLTITGINNYCDSLEHDFVVTAAKKDIPPAEKLTSISKAAKVQDIAAYDYNGEAKVPVPVVTLKKGGAKLVEGTHYSVAYKNNVKAGTAKVIITGLEKGGYKGSITKSFKINKISFKTNQLIVNYSKDFNLYQKGGVKLDGMDVSIMIAGTEYKLTEGVDYKVKYYNNKKVPKEDSAVKPYFVIEAKGSFKGKSSKYEFTILRQTLASVNGFAPDVTYSNKPGNIKVKPVLTDINGKKLVVGTDYEKGKDYVYDEAVDVMNKGAKVRREAWDAVRADDIVPAGTALSIALRGKGNYRGNIRVRFKVTKNDISKAKAFIKDQVYTGDEIRLTNEDILINNGAVPADGFEILGYSNNVEPGTAKVVVRGIGNYGGTVTFKFKIVKQPVPGNWIASWRGILETE